MSRAEIYSPATTVGVFVRDLLRGACVPGQPVVVDIAGVGEVSLTPGMGPGQFLLTVRETERTQNWNGRA